MNPKSSIADGFDREDAILQGREEVGKLSKGLESSGITACCVRRMPERSKADIYF